MDTSHFGHRLLSAVLMLASFSPIMLGAPLESPMGDIDPFQQALEVANLRGERHAPNLYVNVLVNTQPETIVLHPGQTIQIRCAAQADLTINDFLYVSFYRQFGEYTHMPLSSGDIGVMVEPAVPTTDDFAHFEESDNPDVVKTVKVLTLGPEAYDTLDNGRNLFYCKALSKSGERQLSYFFVKRVAPRRPSGYPRFRRWTPPPRA